MVDPRPGETLNYVENPFDGTLIAVIMSAPTTGRPFRSRVRNTCCDGCEDLA